MVHDMLPTNIEDPSRQPLTSSAGNWWYSYLVKAELGVGAKVGLVCQCAFIVAEIVLQFIVVAESASTLNALENNPQNVTKLTSDGTRLHGAADADAFKASFISFCFWVAISVHLKTMFLVLALWSGRELYLNCALSVCLVDMAVMVSEACMLNNSGVLSWEGQFWDLALHAVFISTVFMKLLIGAIAHPITDKKDEQRTCCCGCCCSCACAKFVFRKCIPAAMSAVMLYAPVSWAIVGAQVFTRITGEDFAPVMDSRTEQVLVILMEIGRVGQLMWYLVLVCVVLYAVKFTINCVYKDLLIIK